MTRKRNKRLNKLWKKAVKKRTAQPNGTWGKYMKQEEEKRKKHEEKWAKEHPNVDAINYRTPGSVGTGKKK